MPMHQHDSELTLHPCSLITQAADILRAELQRGRWSDYLPPERSLCDLLHISRPTLRMALAELQREKWIQKCHGQRTRVTARSRKPRTPGSRRTIGLLSSESLVEMRASHLLLVDELRRHLQEEERQLELHCDARLIWGRPQRVVQQICEHNPAACWVLLSQGVNVQRWFQEQGLKAVVLGSCHKGIRLPSMDSDYRASCHHAAGTFLGMGHRRIAFLMPQTRFAGDLAGQEGFCSATQSTPHTDLVAPVARHDGTVEGIQRALNSLFQSKRPPTGLLVSHPQHLLTAMTHLAKLRLRVPEDVSLICRDDDEFLAHLVPSVARYVISYSDYARRLSHLVFQTATGHLQTRKVLITAKFQRGDSLADPRRET